MSPDLTAYRTGLVDHVMAKIRENPDIFKISQDVLNDIDGKNHLKRLRRLVGSLLTKNRGIMKNKITKSIYSGTGINKLTKALAPRETVLTAAHWNRVSFLRACLMELEKLSPPQQTAGEAEGTASINPTGTSGVQDNTAGGTNSEGNESGHEHNSPEPSEEEDEDGEDSSEASQQYWKFVDRQSKFRAKARKMATPEVPAAEVLRCVFNSICKKDVAMFADEFLEGNSPSVAEGHRGS
ncbi:hypothetical protein AX14_011834 [Amanita brunnescens Koide BX004]|nr:hypothetical protein AX14_011834 [Amanita brunnescens Koide BX004]